MAPTTPGATKPMTGIDVTVRELLTAYEAGELTLPQLASIFRSRNWPSPAPPATDAQRWGVEDSDVPGDDDWQLVDHWSSLTPDEYQTLAQAHSAAVSGGKERNCC